jgi:hypothetical protein
MKMNLHEGEQNEEKNKEGHPAEEIRRMDSLDVLPLN